MQEIATEKQKKRPIVLTVFRALPGALADSQYAPVANAGLTFALPSFVKERAAHLLELDDLLAQLVLAGLEFGGQTGDAQERARAAVDQLLRQRDFVVRQRAAAHAALIHRT